MAYKNLSIRNAIVKLQNHREKLDRAVDNGVRECAERGVQLAKENLRSYEFKRFPSELEQSINRARASPRHYKIDADGGYGLNIEYGTGITGEDKAHPKANKKILLTIAMDSTKKVVYIQKVKTSLALQKDNLADHL